MMSNFDINQMNYPGRIIAEQLHSAIIRPFFVFFDASTSPRKNPRGSHKTVKVLCILNYYYTNNVILVLLINKF